MKKICHFNLLVLLTLFIIGCSENKNATAKEDVNLNHTTSAENIETETKPQEKKSQIIVSKTDPPKYADKAALMAFLIERFNHFPEAPLTKEQIDQINALAEESRVTTFKNQHACSMFQRRIAQKIKSKVLTPEQLLLYKGKRSKTKK